MGNKLLEFVDLTVKIREKTLYHNFSHTIREGDRYIILGPNGAGKTILLKLITCGKDILEKQIKDLHVSGQMLDSNGNDILRSGMERKQIVYIAQNEEDQRMDKATIQGQVKYVFAPMTDIEPDIKKLDEYLKRFNIRANRKAQIKTLSGGEKKIVQLIPRLMTLDRTKLLLLDEPLNHLSFQNSKVFNEIMRQELADNPNLAIIVVSHCRALNFVTEALKYNDEKKILENKPYQAYDCFTTVF